jgi:hypothetical protein
MPTKTAAQKAEVQAPAAIASLPELDELDRVFAEEGEPDVEDGTDRTSSFAEPVQAPSYDWEAAAAESKRAQDEAVQEAVRQAIAALGLDKFVEKPDVSPHVKIQAMDMSALDRGERPQDNPLFGHWYEFHVGHFQTNDENAARQLHWMMENVPVDAQGQTVGGNLAIYEDDNSVVYKCPDPECPFVTASPAGYKAHRRATHGEIL